MNPQAQGLPPELMDAIARRQGGGQPQSAPQEAPISQDPMQPGAPQAAPAPVDPMAAQAPIVPFDPGETSIILRAFDSRLKAISDMGKAVLGVHPTQQPPQPVTQ